jgi:hypothetical protein
MDDGSGDIVVGELRNDDGIWFGNDSRFDAGDEPFGDIDGLDGGDDVRLRGGVGECGGDFGHVAQRDVYHDRRDAGD